ncbi:cobyrinate a,c-diamide synthase [Halorhodospira halochloris]|uniref:cobyrinate a,c-diamide synthase n=1 Tax=Halorhodospira halochloris TaxID=1052 RepID=UPI001F5B96B5|nr:cobyrinate a,c-diamide synthase [Halorhodospira halochloris]
MTAPSSGQGKSLITAALARLHKNAGRRVRVFKHGPDYLDPMVLEVASGAPVYQLHPWMIGSDECRYRVAAAAQDADVILVEGAMGLYDGSPSSADLASLLGLPVALVVDAKAMAETFGAIVAGIAGHRDDIDIFGVIANRVGSQGHAAMLRSSVPQSQAWLGAVPRSDALAVADRHLGLVQAEELHDLDERLGTAADVLAEAGLGELPPAVHFADPEPLPPPPALLAGKRIAVARDRAFAFIYRANIELLEAMGAELAYFSPLEDLQVPEADAIWLPGGYPELYAAELAANSSMLQSLRDHHRGRGGRGTGTDMGGNGRGGKGGRGTGTGDFRGTGTLDGSSRKGTGTPILAECGGLMYCATEIHDKSGARHAMLGLLPGKAEMAERLVGLGLQYWQAGDEQLRGHTFHHSRFNTEEQPAAYTSRRSGGAAEPIFKMGSLTATYFHGYFPSAPKLVACFFST